MPSSSSREGNLEVLLDATVVLVASLTALTVAGTIVVPVTTPSMHESHIYALEIPLAERAIELPSRAEFDGFASAEGVAPSVAGDARALSSTTGMALLVRLAQAPPSMVAGVVAALSDEVHTLLDAPPAPRRVAAWWAGLGASAQRSLSTGAPEIVGNLDGIPFAVRNDVNRGALRSTIRELELRGGGSIGRALATQDLQRLTMLYAIVDALGPATANPPRSLITLDTHDAGKVAIVLGNLAEADYVSFMIPGMFITVGGNIVEWTDAAARLYDEQVSWLTLLADAGQLGDRETVATVAWIGYQTPHLLNVGSLDLAYEGRDAIAAVVGGLQALRGADQPFISLLAHSYGSTAALLALSDSTTVDALAMIGSPGSPAQSVDELNVRGDVFVGEAPWDPISNSSFFGSDPGAAAYGAHVMSVAGTVDAITKTALAASTGHNEYFSPGTEAMRNLALIGIGMGELVTDGSQLDAGRTLALLP